VAGPSLPDTTARDEARTVMGELWVVAVEDPVGGEGVGVGYELTKAILLYISWAAHEYVVEGWCVETRSAKAYSETISH